MANEPENPIEKLLLDAAKKRDEDAGGSFELHPATRGLLQSEVTRKFRKELPKSEPAPGMLKRLWPRFAWATAILLALAALVWMFSPTTGVKNEAMLARKERARAASPVTESGPVPAAEPPAATAPDSAPVTTAAQSRAVKSEAPLGKMDKALDESKNQPAPAPAPAPTPTPAPDSIPEVAMEKKSPAAGFGGVALQDSEKSKAASSDHAGAKDRATPAVVASLSSNSPKAPAPESEKTASPSAASAAPMPAEPAAVVQPAPTSDGSVKQAQANTLALKSESPAREAFAPSGSAAVAGNVNGYVRSITNAVASQHAAQPQTFYALIDGTANPAEDALTTRKPSQAVLTSFRVEQDGSDLRIIDQDGSVYSGYVQPATSANRRRSSEAMAPAAALASARPASLSRQDYTFEVTGTNVTLHKKVVFKGNLTTVTNLPLFKAGASVADGLQAIGGQAPQSQLLLNSSITGKFSVGGGKEVEIKAAFANP